MLCHALIAVLAAEPKTPEPKDFYELIDKSKHHYRIEGEDHPVAQWAQQNAMRAWPEAHPGIPTLTREKRPDGSFRVTEVTHAPEVEKMLEVSEPLFEAKQYKEAEAEYAKILKRFPGDYEVTLHWGDTALLDGRPKDALARYEQAGKLNPHDVHSWWYRGDALASLGRGKDALLLWIHALALRPRSRELLNDLEINVPHLGLELSGPVFLPNARVEVDGDTTIIRTGGKTWWLAWAMCKAAWASEPEFRERMTGSRDHGFSMLEERQCLINLAAVYGTRDTNKDADDPVAEYVLTVGKAHMLDGLIAYEIAPRVFPVAMATSDDAGREALEQYIKKFVLVKHAQ